MLAVQEVASLPTETSAARLPWIHLPGLRPRLGDNSTRVWGLQLQGSLGSWEWTSRRLTGWVTQAPSGTWAWACEKHLSEASLCSTHSDKSHFVVLYLPDSKVPRIIGMAAARQPMHLVPGRVTWHTET